MDDTSNTPDLMSLIYDAATEYRKWPYVLASLIRTLDIESAALYFIDSRTHELSFLTTAGMTKELIEGIKENYGQSAPFYNLTFKGPVGDIMTANMLPKIDAFTNDPLAQNVLLPTGLDNMVAEVLIRDEAFTAVISLHSTAQTGPFRKGQMATFNKLSPHLIRAINILRRFNAIEGQRQGMTELLQRLPLGVMLLSKEGLVMEMNKRADKIIENGDGLAVDRAGHLRSLNQKDNRALKKLIKQSVGTGQDKQIGTPDAMTVESMASGKKLNILGTPLRRLPTVTAGHFPAAAIFIGDPGGETGSSIATLRKLYGLSKSEARLAEALSKGKNLKMIAEEFGVSISTLRSQLHSAFGKTSASNQADLIRLVLTGPAAYEDHSAEKK
ncbi:MAG: hypothetical protein OQJ97_05790 [Rhodospirillales bacterium]|nr:hypothetical protein [Rhodospirillales bacterium]